MISLFDLCSILNAQASFSTFNILDMPFAEIKGMDGVEEENHQDGQHPQPIEIMQPHLAVHAVGCL